jgi:hypothetical protein
MQELAMRQENSTVRHESASVYYPIDRRDPAEKGATAQSIARARAAQQRERASFALGTGVQVDSDGRLLLRFDPPRSRAMAG